MIKADSFQEKRRDGKIILETMSVQDVINKGWGVDQIVAVRWKNDVGNVELKNSEGILAEVLPDRSGVVALVTIGNKDVLKVFNSDGTERLIIPNHQNISGSDITGIFEWFEPSSIADGVSFGVVFSDRSSGVSYQLDIDSTNGKVVSEKLNR